jgi:hypothetical protein
LPLWGPLGCCFGFGFGLRFVVRTAGRTSGARTGTVCLFVCFFGVIRFWRIGLWGLRALGCCFGGLWVAALGPLGCCFGAFGLLLWGPLGCCFGGLWVVAALGAFGLLRWGPLGCCFGDFGLLLWVWILFAVVKGSSSSSYRRPITCHFLFLFCCFLLMLLLSVLFRCTDALFFAWCAPFLFVVALRCCLPTAGTPSLQRCCWSSASFTTSEERERERDGEREGEP